MSDRPRGKPRSRSRSRDRYQSSRYNDRTRRDDRRDDRHRDEDRARLDRRQSFHTSSNSGNPRAADRGRASIGGGRNNFQADFRPNHGNIGAGRSTLERTQNENIQLYCNFIQVLNRPGWTVNRYHVIFEPEIESIRLRRILLNSHNQMLPINTFDGTNLYTIEKLSNDTTELESVRKYDNQKVKIHLIFRENYETNSENIDRLFNIIFKRCLNKCNLIEFGKERAYFDLKNPEKLIQYHLSIAAGYKAQFGIYQSKLLLSADVVHKLMNTETVFDLMNDIFHKSHQSRWKEECCNKLIGSTVIAWYNKFKTYRIDDIDWERTPSSSFKIKNESVTFIDYYQKNYNITINEKDQPLLLVRVKNKNNDSSGKDSYDLIYLVPSLCILTGPAVIQEFSKNFNMKKDLDAVTKLNVDIRMNRLKNFINLIRQNKEAKGILDQWQIAFNPELTKCNAVVLKSERIFLKNQNAAATGNSWMNILKEGEHLVSIPLKNWVLIYHPRDQTSADFFMREVANLSQRMGFHISNGKMYRLNDRGTNSTLFVNAIKDSIRSDLQMIVCILPNNAKDTYDAIKRVCCIETGIPSQCITSKILENKIAKSAITKIAIQMNCKLGGVIWGVHILTRNSMIVGIDIFRDSANRNNLIVAFVSSTNGTQEDRLNCTKYFSRCVLQAELDEGIDKLQMLMVDALNAYFKNNNTYPDKIFIYRDGVNVSDGQFQKIKDKEIIRIKKAFEEINPNYKPNYVFITVKKRGNAKFFYNKDNRIQNPPAGTVIDNTVVKNNMEFYLIPQPVDRGTVTPTHFNILDKNIDLALDKIQIFTYKLTHLYYNWPGQIRTPGICQYASKLAHLVGESLHHPHSPNLDDKLFYL